MFVLVLALTHGLKLYKAFILEQLWNWFLAPALHLDPISYWIMCGVLLLIEAWREQKMIDGDDYKTRTEAIMDLCGPSITSTVCLVVGWVIHAFLV